MKQILKMIVAFFLICIIGTFCGAFLFILYVQCTGYVAGTVITPFQMRLFIAGFLMALPATLMVSPLFLTLYAIRHSIKLSGSIAFFVIQFIVWSLLFPLASTPLINQNSSFFCKNMASVGYFRKYGNNLYYYTKISPSESRNYEVAKGLKIKLSEFSVTQVKKPEILNNEALRKTTSDFSDTLAEEILIPPAMIKHVQMLFSIPEYISKNIYSWHGYFSVLSMGLALIMIYVLKEISTWKLLNTILTIVTSIGILCVNSFHYRKTPFFIDFSEKIQNSIPINVPAIIYINAFFVLILAVIGIIQLIKHKGE